MKCIKEKCKYCRGHMFYSSINICKADPFSLYSFRKDTGKDVKCIINTCIDGVENKLKELKAHKQYIKENQ